jgi:hypothetical protein
MWVRWEFVNNVGFDEAIHARVNALEIALANLLIFPMLGCIR